MNYKEIVAEAWEFTQENKRIAIWYGAIPAFFSTTIGIGYLIYQYYAFLSSKLFQHWSRSFLSLFFSNALDFLQNHRNFIGPLLVVLIIGLIGYFFIPVLCQGALIQLIARRYNGQKVRIRQGLSYGLRYFLQLFEYSLFVKTFSMWSVFSTFAMMIRTFGTPVLSIAIPLFIFIVVMGFLMTVFFTYSEFFIVIDGDGVFTSITKSANLVFRHLEETLLLTVLMLIIGIRIIIQILFMLLIPIVALGMFYLFMHGNMPQLAYVVGGIIAVSGLVVASYLNGLIHLFAVSVWTFTFLKLTSKEEVSARQEEGKPA
jgi:hypothetical protein